MVKSGRYFPKAWKIPEERGKYGKQDKTLSPSHDLLQGWGVP